MHCPLRYRVIFLLLLVGATSRFCAQTMPHSSGEILTGGSLCLAEAVHGKPTLLVASFSRESSRDSAEWIRALHNDPAFAGSAIYQLVMLQRAPALVRPLIRRGLRNQTPAAFQNHTLLLTSDELAWHDWLHAGIATEPSVIALDASGKILWSGTGPSGALLQKLKAALR